MTGYGLTTEPRLRRWAFTDYDTDITEADRTVFGQWAAWTGRDMDGARIPAELPTDSEGLEDFTIVRFDSRLSDDPTDLLPVLDTLLVDTYPNARLFFLGETDRHFVSYDVANVIGTIISSQDPTLLFYELAVSNPVVGLPFDLDRENIDIGFEGIGGTGLVDTATKRVWAGLSERGTTAGLVVVGGGVGEDGQQEEIEVRTRYDAAISFGAVVVDDLGREWAVASSRTTDDRRFLVFDGIRTVRLPSG